MICLRILSISEPYIASNASLGLKPDKDLVTMVIDFIFNILNFFWCVNI